MSRFPQKLGRRARALSAAARSFPGQIRAATAVEFGLIAAPFIALLVAILETTLVMMAQSVLQEATTQASRLIMTGQAQNGNLSAAQFKQTVCNDAQAMFSCGGIVVSVQTANSFSSVSLTNPVTSGKLDASKASWSPGGPGSIEVVQAFYAWPVFLAPLGFNLTNGNLSGNNLLLVGTAAFRNEPY
jgi:Flp pilus assembly protein TadG